MLTEILDIFIQDHNKYCFHPNVRLFLIPKIRTSLQPLYLCLNFMSIAYEKSFLLFSVLFSDHLEGKSIIKSEAEVLFVQTGVLTMELKT